MRTLILSDIHMGPDGDFDIFAGAKELPAYLERFVSPPTRVIINGDGVDFLMNMDPLTLDPARAVEQAQAIANAPSTAPVFEVLGRILAAGGEVEVLIGNHDIELALSEVQEVFRGALKQSAKTASRMVFIRCDKPYLLDQDGARILITHGQHSDEWNRIPWEKLPGAEQPDAAPEGFQYPPGSMLVKTLLNPAKKYFRMRFADLLKPDFRGAVLTAMAVDPSAIGVVWKKSTIELITLLASAKASPNTFADGEEAIPMEDLPELGLGELLGEAGLTPAEKEALQAQLSGQDEGPEFFADDSFFDRIKAKLADAGLRRYAAVHRRVAGNSGESYFSLEPTKVEWTEAQRLARDWNAGAVIIGHTHSARWRTDSVGAGSETDAKKRPLTFLNTGTWIWMMRLPTAAPPDADPPTQAKADKDWQDYLQELRENPSLEPEHQKLVRLEKRFTAALVDSAPNGARLSLVEWKDGQEIVLGSDIIPPSM